MRPLLRRLILLVAMIVALSYFLIAGVAQRVITPAEYGQFSLAVLGLTFGTHPAEPHPSRWSLLAQALRSPSPTWHGTFGAKSYDIPLPPYTVRLSGHSDTYVTFATSEQLHTYYAASLPNVGWQGNERMGASHLFYSGNMGLDLTVRYYWSSLISEIHLSLYSQ